MHFGSLQINIQIVIVEIEVIAELLMSMWNVLEYWRTSLLADIVVLGK